MTTFRLNGREVTVKGPADAPLLWAIRDEAGLTGTKFGCGIGQCGACTVHVNGEAVRACMMPTSAVAGQSVTTIEDGVFVGSNSALVAPVTLGRNATIGAGSVITKNAPSDQLTIARGRQMSVDGWQRPKKK